MTEPRLVPAGEAADLAPPLASLLADTVAAGASVNFVLPFGESAALDWWQSRGLPGVTAGGRLLWVIGEGSVLAGCVMLDLDTPPNQPHRGEVTKLLVHPTMRRRGLGRALMQALHDEAARRGRSLLTLDTRAGDKAEPLYESLGYVAIGRFPAFSLDPLGSGRLDATTLMYRQS